MTGMLGVDGHDDEAPVLRPAGAALPATLAGLLVGRDGRPVGLDLPSLDVRGAAEAWRGALGRGPFYVRFEDRDAVPDVARVQRLARLGEVWLDGPLKDVDVALDLLIAGASRLVVWSDDPDLLDAVGDSAVLGWDGSRTLDQVVAAAAPHAAPILATAPLPRHDDPGLYQAPPAPWSGRFEVPLVGTTDDGDGE